VSSGYVGLGVVSSHHNEVGVILPFFADADSFAAKAIGGFGTVQLYHNDFIGDPDGSAIPGATCNLSNPAPGLISSCVMDFSNFSLKPLDSISMKFTPAVGSAAVQGFNACVVLKQVP